MRHGRLRATQRGLIDRIAIARPRLWLVGPLGWVPILSATTAFGLLAVAAAYTESRALADPGRAALIFWAGLLLMLLPIAFRLVSASPTRAERLGLVLLAGVGMYMVKVLHDPTLFTFFDEFLHTRTANAILETKHLFTPNTMLLASSYYPGLENVATAIAELSGASVFDCGIWVIGAARIVFVISLFLLFELISGSARLAGIATLVYAANPSFIFFSAVFAYESLALPFVVLTLYCVARRYRSMDPPTVSLVMIPIAASATVVTHHVSSVALSVILILWSAVHWLSRDRLDVGVSPIKPAIFSLVAALTWLIVVATVTVRYLAGTIERAALEIVRLVAGQSSARELFRVTGAPVQPFWEIAAGYATVALILVAMPLGLWRLWRNGRLNSLSITLAIFALGYPAALVARFTEQGAIISARATTFVFIGVAFIMATAFVRVMTVGDEADDPIADRESERWPGSLRWPDVAKRSSALRAGLLGMVSRPRPPGTNARRPTRMMASAPRVAEIQVPRDQPRFKTPMIRSLGLTLAFALLFVGGTVVAVPPWARLPGEYLVGGDTRAIEPMGIAAARWTRVHLGTENRFMVDRTNRLLLGTIGEQHPVTASGDRVNIRSAYFAAVLGRRELGVLRAAKLRYALVDRRLSSALPMVGVYVEAGERREGPRTEPMDPAALAKFDPLDGVSRLYDNGAIQIYDIDVLTK